MLNSLWLCYIRNISAIVFYVLFNSFLFFSLFLLLSCLPLDGSNSLTESCTFYFFLCDCCSLFRSTITFSPHLCLQLINNYIFGGIITFLPESSSSGLITSQTLVLGYSAHQRWCFWGHAPLSSGGWWLQRCFSMLFILKETWTCVHSSGPLSPGKRGMVVDSQAINNNKLAHMNEQQITTNSSLALETSWMRRKCLPIPRRQAIQPHCFTKAKVLVDSSPEPHSSNQQGTCGHEEL